MLEFRKISERNFEVNLPRGDNAELELAIVGYDLKKGDKIVFKMGKNLSQPLIADY